MHPNTDSSYSSFHIFNLSLSLSFESVLIVTISYSSYTEPGIRLKVTRQL